VRRADGVSVRLSVCHQDASRPLRRHLKQLGEGSLEEGLRRAHASDDSLRELERMLGVDKQVRQPAIDLARRRSIPISREWPSIHAACQPVCLLSIEQDQIL
jgi:hypothetical protein